MACKSGKAFRTLGGEGFLQKGTRSRALVEVEWVQARTFTDAI